MNSCTLFWNHLNLLRPVVITGFQQLPLLQRTHHLGMWPGIWERNHLHLLFVCPPDHRSPSLIVLHVTDHFLTFYSLSITLRTTGFNIQKFYMVLTLRLYVFVRFSEQTATFALYNLSRLVLYNRGGECLLRGTHWIFIYNRHI